MTTLAEKAFFSTPKSRGAVYQYGMLMVCLALLAVNVVLLARAPAARDHRGNYCNLVVALMLLFNHLAFAFRWPHWLTLVIRTTALLWVVVGCAYVFYAASM